MNDWCFERQIDGQKDLVRSCFVSDAAFATLVTDHYLISLQTN